MHKKTAFTLLLLLSASILLDAHEFWVKPSRFFFKKNEVVDLVAMVGESYEGEPWGGQERRFTSFEHFSGSKQRSLLKHVVQSDESVAIKPLKLTAEGTQLLAFSTNNSYIELGPVDFLAYLREDGLDNAIEFRQKNNENNKTSRELYRRSAKVLLQVGETPTAGFDVASDLHLDIIPKSNPYALTKAGGITFEILYQTKPLANALVRCWQKIDGKTELKMLRSDKNGLVTFDIDKAGDYMISVVCMERLSDNTKADWQSTWGSLVFGVSFN